MAHAPCLLVETHEAGAQNEVCLVLDDGLYEAFDLLGLVLSISVQVDHDVGALELGYREAGAQGVALAPVDDVGDYGDPLLAGDGRRGVGRAVIHHYCLHLISQ